MHGAGDEFDVLFAAGVGDDGKFPGQRVVRASLPQLIHMEWLWKGYQAIGPHGPGAANPQVQLAGRSDDAFERMSNRTTHSDVLTKRAAGRGCAVLPRSRALCSERQPD